MPRRCRPRARSNPRGQLTLHAQLYKPDGDGPFPTVIALHGCGGLGGDSEPVPPRYRDWAEQLLKAGHAVVLPDSYGSRELGPQCRVSERRVLARRERVADIKASRLWLCSNPGRPGPRQPDGMGERRQRPVVGGASANVARHRAGLPLRGRVLSGLPALLRPWLEHAGADAAADRREDDVSSPQACRQMVEGARGRSALTQIEIYPGAPHDFDLADLPLRAIGGRRRVAGTRPHRHRRRSARADAQKTRRGMAGALNRLP